MILQGQTPKSGSKASQFSSCLRWLGKITILDLQIRISRRGHNVRNPPCGPDIFTKEGGSFSWSDQVTMFKFY